MKKKSKHIRRKKHTGLGVVPLVAVQAAAAAKDMSPEQKEAAMKMASGQTIPGAMPQVKSSPNLKEVVIYGTLGLVVVGGTIYLASKFVRKQVANTQEKKSLDVDSSAASAKKIRMALDNDMWWGWGTDEEALRKAIIEIPSKEDFKKVAASYKKLYGDPLTADLQGDLSTAEYNEMLAIVAGKPERKGEKSNYNHSAAAVRLYNAMSIWYGIFPGTDEDAIKAVFLEVPTQADYKKIESIYYQKYGNTLQYDLEGDLSQSYIDEYMSILRRKPKS
jgi:hypothetical protein